MERDYSYAVLIGRFQPLHNGHVALIEQALQIADKVLILLGSSFAARTPKNPFTFDERKQMIRETFPEIIDSRTGKPVLGKIVNYANRELPSATTTTPYNNRIFIEPLRDYFYSDDVWLAHVQTICAKYFDEGDTVALMGSYKDSSSYYLNLFPQWEFVPQANKSRVMDATKVREKLFDVGTVMYGWDDAQPEGKPVIKRDVLERQDKWFSKNLPEPVARFLQNFRETTAFGFLADDYIATDHYKKQWSKSPFPPTFVTADAVVTCSGHILIVRRGGNPGKGLLALPGGFLRQEEKIKDAALRELKEETRIKVDKLILESSIVDSHVFDYPGRSLRGRTITHAFHVKLKNGKLPEVKQGSDAKGAFWMPLMEVNRRCEEFFEDHIHIINHFINHS